MIDKDINILGNLIMTVKCMFFYSCWKPNSGIEDRDRLIDVRYAYYLIYVNLFHREITTIWHKGLASCKSYDETPNTICYQNLKLEPIK